jgi:ParB-like chromosome segregation protein Spo0J
MQVEQWPIDRLVFYARNPRKNDAVVDRMVGSIREFGFKIPVLARTDGEVVDGHLRLKAARKLGISEVPVILCDEWTPAQVKAFRLLVNRSVTWADWDEELLGSELLDIKALDFDLELTGFDSTEIDRLLLGDVGMDPREDIAPGPAGESGHQTGRPVALRRAPGTVRRLDRRGRRVVPAGDGEAVPDGDRPAVRRRL